MSWSPIHPGPKLFPVWGIHNISGQPVPVPHHPHGKELLPNISPSSTLFHSKAITPCLSLLSLIKNPSPSLLWALFTFWNAALKSPQSLHLSRQNNNKSLIAEVLQLSDCLYGPSLESLQQVSVLLMLGDAQLNAVLPVGSHRSRGGNSHPLISWLRFFRHSVVVTVGALNPSAHVSEKLFNNNTDIGIECILSKLVDDTKFSGAVDITERADAILRDLHKLEGWTVMNLMRFNKAKCKVLYLCWGNPKYLFRLREGCLESSPVKWELGILFDEKLNMSQQHAVAAQKAKSIHDWSKMLSSSWNDLKRTIRCNKAAVSLSVENPSQPSPTQAWSGKEMGEGLRTHVVT